MDVCTIRTARAKALWRACPAAIGGWGSACEMSSQAGLGNCSRNEILGGKKKSLVTIFRNIREGER